MELLKYIKEQNITDFSVLKLNLESTPFNLKIKEDKTYLNLFLIHNTDGSDTSLNIVNECNGIILEKNTFKIVCYSFNKCLNQLTLPDYLDKNNLYIENAIEGTMVKYYYYNDTWILSTKKCIDSNKARWLSTKTFYEMFNDCIVNYDISDKLNINYCYTFIITHPENNIVVNYTEPFIFHISTRDLTTLSEIEVDLGLYKLPKTKVETDKIDNVIENIMATKQLSFEGLIFIDNNYNRWKIRNPYFSRARELWGNTNHRIYRYVEIRKDTNLLHEYLLYFPQDSELFGEFENKITDLSYHVLSVYIDKHVKKTIDKVPYYLSKIIYKLHGDFYKTHIKTDINKVGMALLETDTKLLCFMLNHYEKSLNNNENNNENNMDIENNMEVDEN